MSILSIRFYVAVYFVSGTNTQVETLVVTLERQHTGWWLIVCRWGAVMVIMHMLNLQHILLHMVLFLPLTDTMVRNMIGLVLSMPLEMAQLCRITMIIVITNHMSQLLLILIVGRLLCMREVADLSLPAGIIIDMDITVLWSRKMLDMVIPLMPLVHSMSAKHQYHPMLIFTSSRVDMTITRVINLMWQEAITNRVVDGLLKLAKTLLEGIVIHVLPVITSRRWEEEEIDGPHLQAITVRGHHLTHVDTGQKSRCCKEVRNLASNRHVDRTRKRKRKRKSS